MEEGNGQSWKRTSWAALGLVKRYWVFVMAVVALPAFASFGLPLIRDAAVFTPDPAQIADVAVQVLVEPAAPTRSGVATPDFVKGIYITSSTVSSTRRFQELVDLVDKTELNAMVIDIKNGRGDLAFMPKSDKLKPLVEKKPGLGDVSELTARLHEKGIYLIARTFVFQDPILAETRRDLGLKRSDGALWRDRKGVPWTDPSSKEVWQYNVDIAVEAFEAGFDEIQFDYVRFPTDGNLKAIIYPFYDGKTPKFEVMREFYSFLNEELRVKKSIPISVDLFGLVMWQHEYDLGIGQRLDIAANNVDFISPMVYPSHYATGFLGYKNPALYPYEVVYRNLVKGEVLMSKMRDEYFQILLEDPEAQPMPVATIRPWIQDFDIGADYDAAKVKAQMKASVDGKASGWLLWNARNIYTLSALKSE